MQIFHFFEDMGKLSCKSHCFEIFLFAFILQFFLLFRLRFFVLLFTELIVKCKFWSLSYHNHFRIYISLYYQQKKKIIETGSVIMVKLFNWESLSKFFITIILECGSDVKCSVFIFSLFYHLLSDEVYLFFVP